jgi:hypothetical protein
MQPAPIQSADSTKEWFRLEALATKYEPRMRLAYTRSVRDGRQVNTLELRKEFISIVSAVCLSTADVYGLVFNPNSPIYLALVEHLTEHFANQVDSAQAKEEVKRIVPKDLPLNEMRERLNTFGLDARAALRIERHIQELENSKKPVPKGDILRTTRYLRGDAVRQRGNLLSRTEVNRAVNLSLESLWVDNIAGSITKSRAADLFNPLSFLDSSVSTIGALPRNAKKEWVTRRDGRVCTFCDPLDGMTATLGQPFDTEYGLYQSPPAHPQCRCILILGA